jgi:MoaA/NifB/PqqE/SkfB family radical SAM enzyme
MGFPPRLTADLTLGLAARAMRLQRKQPLILHLEPDRNFSTASAALDKARRVPSPIVWIAGSEPLEHPEIARVANALAAAGRHVFLQTGGILLRQRIHEFQPSSRLHLTIRFDGTQPSHDLRAGREGGFHAALDGIRTAKLSGFLICAHLILHADSDAVELTMLHDELRKLNLDGFLISPAALIAELERSLTEARRRLLSRRWAFLSRLLDSVALPATLRESSQIPRGAVVELPPASCEESVQAP